LMKGGMIPSLTAMCLFAAVLLYLVWEVRLEVVLADDLVLDELLVEAAYEDLLDFLLLVFHQDASASAFFFTGLFFPFSNRAAWISE
jgi:hypothetical protein